MYAGGGPASRQKQARQLLSAGWSGRPHKGEAGPIFFPRYLRVGMDILWMPAITGLEAPDLCSYAGRCTFLGPKKRGHARKWHNPVNPGRFILSYGPATFTCCAPMLTCTTIFSRRWICADVRSIDSKRRCERSRWSWKYSLSFGFVRL